MLNFHQKRILQQKAERELREEGYRDRMLDMTTDAERLRQIADVYERIEYDEDYNRKLAEVL